MLDVAKSSQQPDVREWALTFGRLFGEYMIDGNPVHNSDTCIVILGTDKANRQVALKFMMDEAQWRREIDMRKFKTSEGHDCVLDKRRVISLDLSRDLDAEALRFCAKEPRLACDTQLTHVHVMPRAENDLSDTLSHGRVAGRNKKQVVHILRQVASHLLYLHETCERIHGDLKARNIVRVRIVAPDGTVSFIWILIDLDASCGLRKQTGQKVTSSSCFPPEMARQQLAIAKRRDESPTDGSAVPATVQFELWYFGLLLFQMCTKDGESVWKSTHADNLADEDQDLPRLAYHFEELKLPLVQKIEWPDAADLALWCLQPNADRRPPSIRDVLAHPFLYGDGFTPNDFLEPLVLRDIDSRPHELRFPDRAEKRAQELHMAVENKNYAKVRVLFNHGGVHYNLRLISNSQTLILHRCARLGDVTMVQLLLEEEVLVEAHQSFLDAVSIYGFTALQWCALYDHAQLAEVLIKSGCDTTHTNYRHKTAWDIADAMQASAATS